MGGDRIISRISVQQPLLRGNFLTFRAFAVKITAPAPRIVAPTSKADGHGVNVWEKRVTLYQKTVTLYQKMVNVYQKRVNDYHPSGKRLMKKSKRLS
jgi:hypothetical protein